MTRTDAIINALRAQRDQALDAVALLSGDLAEERAQNAALEAKLKKRTKDNPPPAA